jgi:trigger factor
METTVKHLSDTKVQLTISVGGLALADAEKVALTKLSKTAKVAGFREGHVPPAVAAKHVDQKALQEQTLDDAISKAVATSFVENNIQAIDRPSVEVKKFVPGEELEFTAEVEVLPKITVGDYKKLSAKPEKVTVAAKDIDDVLQRMRQNFAEKKEVKRAAKTGDEVIIDFVGKKDDVAFDGGTATDYALELGAAQFIPGFEEAVVGHKPGETFDVDLKFPKEYHAADLAGQPVVFTVTLKTVNNKALPELNDEFAAKAGPFTSLGELKADMKAELKKQKEQQVNDKWKDALLTELIEKSTITVPDVLLQSQMQSIEQDFQQNLSYRNLSIDQYIESQKFKDIDEWREKEVKPTARKRVQAGLVLSEITKAEGITLTDKEVDEHVEVHKQQYANNPEALKQFESPEVRSEIANHFLSEKTIDRLIALNS